MSNYKKVYKHYERTNEMKFHAISKTTLETYLCMPLIGTQDIKLYSLDHDEGDHDITVSADSFNNDYGVIKYCEEHKILRKILCLLGIHAWIPKVDPFGFGDIVDGCNYCDVYKIHLDMKGW